jgi:hypothetical protein
VGKTNNSYVEDIRTIATSLINGEEYTIHVYGWYGDNYSSASESFVWNYEDYNADPDPSNPNKPDQG